MSDLIFGLALSIGAITLILIWLATFGVMFFRRAFDKRRLPSALEPQ